MECGHTPELNRGANAEVLTVAGDLINWPLRDRGVEWLLEQGRHYEKVYFVLGNHEYYGAPHFGTVVKFWEDIEKKLPRNIHILVRGKYHVYRDVAFIGETLWTQLEPYQQIMFPQIMRDAQVCPGLTAAVLNAENTRARENIAVNLQLNEQWGFKTFVITHHLPTEAVTSTRWAGSKYNCYFANRAGWAEELHADYWHFGHTHDTIDVEHCGTRYICNPYGYHNHETNTEYDNTRVIDV
jgi:hypothetical protein